MCIQGGEDEGKETLLVSPPHVPGTVVEITGSLGGGAFGRTRRRTITLGQLEVTVCESVSVHVRVLV